MPERTPPLVMIFGMAITPITNREAPHVLGPDAEEYADFDCASKSRAVHWTPGELLNLLAGVLMLLLVASFGVCAGLLYNANQPQNLILGTWQAIDHPGIESLQFKTPPERGQSGWVTIRNKKAETRTWSYQFVSRNTVEINSGLLHDFDNRKGWNDIPTFRIGFDGNRLTTEHNAVTYHWQRFGTR
jgi:hypothetical protein